AWLHTTSAPSPWGGRCHRCCPLGNPAQESVHGGSAMQGSTGRSGSLRTLAGGLGLALFLLTGCAMTPGNRLTLFPEGHRLIDSAKDLRRAAPNPMPLPREMDKRLLPTYVVEPGDVLLVQPADLDSPARLPGDQPVLSDGTINLGRYGHL